MISVRVRRFLICSILSVAGLDLAAQTDSLVGQTRAAVTQQLGQPLSTARAGKKEIMVFANGDRVELVEEQVVKHRSANAGGVLSRNGTIYRSDNDGALREDAVLPAVPPPEPEKTVADVAIEPTPEPPSETHEPQAEEELAVDENDDGLPADASDLPGLADLDPEKMLEDLGYEEPEPPPAWANAVGSIIGMVSRLAVVFVILQISLKWIGQPYYLPDIVKVSALYVIVRDGLHAVGNLGGMWQMILFFRVDEIISLFAMAGLLFKFDVTRNGLTALKIAFATKLVAYFLMIAIGVVLSFGLAALY